MPTIKISKTSVEGEFESVQEVSALLRDAFGFQPIAQTPVATPAAAPLRAAPSPAVAERHADREEKLARKPRGASAPVDPPPGQPKRISDWALEACQEGPKTSREIFDWMGRKSLKTTLQSVYGVCNYLLKQERFSRNDDDRYVTVKP